MTLTTCAIHGCSAKASITIQWPDEHTFIQLCPRHRDSLAGLGGTCRHGVGHGGYCQSCPDDMAGGLVSLERPRLPEPDFWLMGNLKGGDFSEEERAEMHDQWHHENPAHFCSHPEQPRSIHRPGWFERLWRGVR